MTHRLHLWLPVGLYMALIFGISSIPDPPDVPDAIGNPGAHALLYFGLGALFVRAFAGGWNGEVTAAIVAAAVGSSALYGISDEIHQAFVPPRTAEASDVVADVLGAAAAAVLLWGRHARRRRRLLRRGGI